MRERTFKLTIARTQPIISKFGEQTRLAEIIGIKLATLSHYLHGRREIPESVLMRLCDAMNAKPSDYLEHPLEQKLADGAFSA